MELRYLNPRLETMTRRELLSLQWERLKTLLERVYQRNDFYRRRFDQCRVTPDSIRSFEDFFERVPLINKKDLLDDQEENSPYGNRLQIPRNKIAYTCLTSGTSGLGQEVHPYSLSDINNLSNSWAYMFCWSGITPGDRAFTTLPIGMAIGGPSYVQAFERYGLEIFPVGAEDAENKLRIMKRFCPHYIVIVPAYLIRLTVLCEQLGIVPTRDFPELKVITVTTQGYSISWAKNMEAIWGVRLCEPYASTQAVPAVMATCERGLYWDDNHRGMMHAIEDHLLFEVLNRETGDHVKSGEEGELIVTTLTREATPLIRYRMDDKVRFLSHEECSCGRPFAGVEAGTVARYDDMLKIKGLNVWPEAIDAVIFSYKELDEYNGRVLIDEEGKEKAIISLEFKPTVNLPNNARVNILKEIKERLKKKVGVTMELQEVAHGTVERFQFKTRRWTDERRKGRQVVKYYAR